MEAITSQHLSNFEKANVSNITESSTYLYAILIINDIYYMSTSISERL